MKFKKAWYDNAIAARNLYGVYVDWEDCFYLCPECGEPIYGEDWSEDDLEEFLCPVCEFYGDGPTSGEAWYTHDYDDDGWDDDWEDETENM